MKLTGRRRDLVKITVMMLLNRHGFVHGEGGRLQRFPSEAT
jgi:hypothetical protein